jgi:hypothetical protein
MILCVAVLVACRWPTCLNHPGGRLSGKRLWRQAQVGSGDVRSYEWGKPAATGAAQGEGAVAATQVTQDCSRALAASKVHPLLHVEWLSVSVGEVLLKAMLRAKLPMRKSVANQTEAATTSRAAQLDLRHVVFRTTFAHRRYLIRTPGSARRLSV